MEEPGAQGRKGRILNTHGSQKLRRALLTVGKVNIDFIDLMSLVPLSGPQV